MAVDDEIFVFLVAAVDSRPGDASLVCGTSAGIAADAAAVVVDVDGAACADGYCGCLTTGMKGH